jgi:hypothetical protein
MTLLETCIKGHVRSGVVVNPPNDLKTGVPLPWPLVASLDTGSLPDWCHPRRVEVPVYADIYLVHYQPPPPPPPPPTSPPRAAPPARSADNTMLAVVKDALAELGRAKNIAEPSSLPSTVDKESSQEGPSDAAAPDDAAASDDTAWSGNDGAYFPRLTRLERPYTGEQLPGFAEISERCPIPPASPPKNIIVKEAFVGGKTTISVQGKWYSRALAVLFEVPGESLTLDRGVQQGEYQFWCTFRAFEEFKDRPSWPFHRALSNGFLVWENEIWRGLEFLRESKTWKILLVA